MLHESRIQVFLPPPLDLPSWGRVHSIRYYLNELISQWMGECPQYPKHCGAQRRERLLLQWEMRRDSWVDWSRREQAFQQRWEHGTPAELREWRGHPGQECGGDAPVFWASPSFPLPAELRLPGRASLKSSVRQVQSRGRTKLLWWSQQARRWAPGACWVWMGAWPPPNQHPAGHRLLEVRGPGCPGLSRKLGVWGGWLGGNWGEMSWGWGYHHGQVATSLTFPKAFEDRKALCTPYEVLAGKVRHSKTDLVGPLIHRKDRSFRVLIRFLRTRGLGAGVALVYSRVYIWNNVSEDMILCEWLWVPRT